MGHQTRDLLEHVLVPVANEQDARATAERLADYEPQRVTVLHVVEKGGGGLDKTPVSYSKEVAADAFEAFHDVFPAATTETAYASNIVQEIHTSTENIDASAIAFRSRGGHRLLQFLSGDRSLKLITGAEIPVIVLPGR